MSTGLWRQSFTGEGMGHGTNPIPDCTRVGPMIFSGGVTALDPDTKQIPEDRDEQIRGMFRNIVRVVELAGGAPSDIGMVTVWLKDYSERAVLNEEWSTLFSDAASRPVRHTISYDFPGGPLKVQCQFIAVVNET